MKMLLITGAALLLILLGGRWQRLCKRSTPWRVRSASRALRKLRGFAGTYANQQRFAYLRKLDSFVFEELVLLCFAERGLRVQRSPYTRDGGSDGTVWIDNEHPVVIQSKRYAKHIQAQHVREFTQLLKRRNRAGVFVHTGRTGRASWQASRGVDLQMISGPQLQKLILGEPLTLFDRIVAASNSTKRLVKTFTI